MFTPYKFTKIISRQSLIRLNGFTQCYCFSADAEQFVSRIKLLEKLKAQDHFPQSLCESGKYILFFNNGMVCLNEENKLVLKEYEGLP